MIYFNVCLNLGSSDKERFQGDRGKGDTGTGDRGKGTKQFQYVATVGSGKITNMQ